MQEVIIISLPWEAEWAGQNGKNRTWALANPHSRYDCRQLEEELEVQRGEVTCPKQLKVTPLGRRLRFASTKGLVLKHTTNHFPEGRAEKGPSAPLRPAPSASPSHVCAKESFIYQAWA